MNDALDLLRMRYQDHLSSDQTVLRTDEDGNQREFTVKVAGKNTRRGIRQAAQWAQITASAWKEMERDWIQNSGSVMVWSDLHLGHHNIIKYANRPFVSANEMNAHMLAQAQARVEDGQWLLFGGDLAMWRQRRPVEEWMSQCPGRKALVIGNHDVRGDQYPKRLEDWQSLGFEAVADVAVLPGAHGAKQAWITHYPLPRKAFKGLAINLHGHIHEHALGAPWANACVEQISYRPEPLLDMLLTADLDRRPESTHPSLR